MSVFSLGLEQRRQQVTLSRLLLRELAALVLPVLGVRSPSPVQRSALADTIRPLLDQYGSASSAVAADFYERQRRETGQESRFVVPLAEPAPDEQVDAALGWVLDQPDGGTVDLDDATAVERARRSALDGTARRLTAQPGRLTLERAIDEDPDAVAWVRITDGDPCAFCAMLAGRGAVYLSRDTALYAEGTRESYHDHDGCTVAPRFRTDRSPLPTANQRYQDLWYETGAYFTGSDARAAYERAVRAQRAGRDVRAAVFDGPAADPERYRRQITHDRKTVEEFRLAAQRGGTNGRPPAGPDGATDPRFSTSR